MRVVSLLPSATEILFAVGAGDAVCGVTFECDFPAQARERRIVSTSTLPTGLTAVQIDDLVRSRIAAGEDLYHLDAGALRDLDPDLIVTQDLCAVCAVDLNEVDAALDHLGCRAEVLTLDPSTLEEVLASIERVGLATGCEQGALELVRGIRQRLGTVKRAVAGLERPRMAVLEWTDPPFSSGHWVPDMVEVAGGVPVVGQGGRRSERITWHDVSAATPDVIVVAPCGFGLDGAHQLAEELVASGSLPAGTPVWAVDADAAFVRPGPRLVDGVEALAAIAHPGVVQLDTGLAVALPSGVQT
ncbi:MAG: ABC transporter substrate-binding protein [Acidimicrobiales bacterium]